MSEISVVVYFKHDDKTRQKQLLGLCNLHESLEGDTFSESFIALCEEISGRESAGGEIGRSYLQSLQNDIREEFYPESVETIAGYGAVSFLCGGGGDRFAGRTVRFIDSLCPGIHVLAWGMGDDDPWEFWFKREGGNTIRHDDEPFDGNDKRIYGTIYRWWHEGLPEKIKEGMLNDDDPANLDGDADVSDEEYADWLSHTTATTDIESDAEQVVLEEMVDAFTGVLGDLFRGGKERPEASNDSFDADEMTENIVRALFQDLDEQESQQSVDGVMKHISRKMKGKVTTIENGKEITLPVNYSLYRMSLKMVMRGDTGFQSDQEITDIQIKDDVATVNAKATMTYLDPMKGEKVTVSTNDVYTLDIVDGKILVTNLVSEQAA